MELWKQILWNEAMPGWAATEGRTPQVTVGETVRIQNNEARQLTHFSAVSCGHEAQGAKNNMPRPNLFEIGQLALTRTNMSKL